MDTITPTRERRGHGSVRWRADRGRYEIRIRDPRTGRRESHYMPGPESPAAEQAAHDERIALITARRAGVRPTSRRLTTGAWLDTWLALQAGRAASTRRANESRIRTYLKPELGRILLAELDESDVARAMARLASRRGERVAALRPATIDAAYRCLSAALSDAVRAGKIASNPAALVTVDKRQAEILPPTIAQVDAILGDLAAHHPREHVLLTMARWTGAREAELLGLRWAELDTLAGLVTIRRQVSGPRLKTRASRRTLLLARPVLAALAGHPRGLPGSLVFATRTGKPLSARNVVRIFGAAADRVGAHPPPESEWPRYRPHDLRHAFATMALEAGAAPTSVSAWLGHASLAQLDRYGHVRAMPGGDSYRRLVEAFGPDADHLFGMARLALAARSDPQSDPQAQRHPA